VSELLLRLRFWRRGAR